VGVPEGLLLIDKPKGITSHDVIDRVRKALGTRKVGHAGTLDPMATGLLLVCVGRATRLLRYLAGMDKTYEGSGRLGEQTDTLDAEGTVTVTAGVNVTREGLRDAASALTGEIRQIPPAYSSVKIAGQPSHRAARRGESRRRRNGRIRREWRRID
jgi:tRNA pseudouridine55 synthase